MYNEIVYQHKSTDDKNKFYGRNVVYKWYIENLKEGENVDFEKYLEDNYISVTMSSKTPNATFGFSVLPIGMFTNDNLLVLKRPDFRKHRDNVVSDRESLEGGIYERHLRIVNYDKFIERLDNILLDLENGNGSPIKDLAKVIEDMKNPKVTS